MMRLSDEVVGRLRDVAAWPELAPDRYEVRSFIGRGGMGVVYAAYDRLLDRDVAFKVSTAPGPGGALEARLRQEARVLARLEHPGIVPIHDAGELADGRWFYVMKLIRGQTLKDHVETLRGEVPVLGVFERIAEAVAFAHAAGVIHRDLKPSNVMIGSFGEVLVLDWGVAKILGAAAAAPVASEDAPTGVTAVGTEAGTRIGTPGFMAPEQQRGEAAAAGPPADVYSLGALFDWMLRGAAVPKRLRAIIRKCLADAPADRYADAGVLVADLARYRAGLAVAAHRETIWDRAGRWFDRYRTFILLVAAYLIMRTAFAWFQRG